MKWFQPEDWLDWAILVVLCVGAAAASHNLRSDIPVITIIGG
ncbi:MAG TPA: hypothetical protein VIF40_18015 [Methylosinus sp.]|jgi:hypothetical protein